MTMLQRQMIIAAAFLAPQVSLAQQESVLLIPSIGFFAQPADMRVEGGARYSFDPAIAFAGAVEIRSSGLPLPLRVYISSASSLKLTNQRPSHGAPVSAGSSAITTFTAGAILGSPRVCGRHLCPRAMIGAGARRYDLDAMLVYDDILEPFADGQTNAALNIGLGVHAKIGRMAVALEANDLVNRIRLRDGRRTSPIHDVVVSLGLGYHLWQL